MPLELDLNKVSTIEVDMPQPRLKTFANSEGWEAHRTQSVLSICEENSIQPVNIYLLETYTHNIHTHNTFTLIIF